MEARRPHCMARVAPPSIVIGAGVIDWPAVFWERASSSYADNDLVCRDCFGRGSSISREDAWPGATAAEVAVAPQPKIIERPGLIKNFVLFPLAHLGASRAVALAGSKAEAASLKAKFDTMWKSADVAVA